MKTPTWLPLVGASLAACLATGSSIAHPHEDQGECDAFCEMQPSFTADQVRERLGDADKAIWIENSVLHVLADIDAERVFLCCDLQFSLHRVAEDDTLWASSFWIRDLDDAFFSFRVINPDGLVGTTMPLVEDDFVYRGSNAPPVLPAVETLSGQLETRVLESGEITRDIQIYLPPGATELETVPVVYSADGGHVSHTAKMVEALILAGQIQPVALVGIPSAPPEPGEFVFPDPRSREYLHTVDTEQFEGHERFVLDVVIPAVEREFPVATRRDQRMVYGYSSGGSWAASMGLRNSDTFGRTAAGSIANLEWVDTSNVDPRTRFLISGGVFEPGFLEGSTDVVNRINAEGGHATLRTFVTGHGSEAFSRLLAEALIAYFPAETETAQPSTAAD